MNPDKMRLNGVGRNRIKHVKEFVFQAKILILENVGSSEDNGSMEIVKGSWYLSTPEAVTTEVDCRVSRSKVLSKSDQTHHCLGVPFTSDMRNYVKVYFET